MVSAPECPFQAHKEILQCRVGSRQAGAQGGQIVSNLRAPEQFLEKRTPHRVLEDELAFTKQTEMGGKETSGSGHSLSRRVQVRSSREFTENKAHSIFARSSQVTGWRQVGCLGKS